MKTFLTELRAIERRTGGLRKYAGPNIQAPTWELAQAECDINFPYLTVIGELVCEVDLDGKVHEYKHALN